MNVLSLFDGMSCGQIALNRAGVLYNNYYASEIDKYAIKVTQHNYPDTVQLGDILDINIRELPKVDLLIGGSPCQGFSFAGKQLNFEDPRSKLFFEFVKIKNKLNPKYFLLENVLMKGECEKVISQCLGVNPVRINSSLVSAQNRRRLYWTNMPKLSQPIDKGIVWRDVRERGADDLPYYYTEKAMQWLKSGVQTVDLPVDKQAVAAIRGRYLFGRRKEFLEFRYDGKTNALTTSRQNNVVVPFTLPNKILADEFFFRYMTPLECERLQTVPDNYTNVVSNTQRCKMLGNGWTVDVIAHIFKGLL